MAKSRLQTALIGLSVTTASMNVVGLLLSQVNLTSITTGYLSPLLILFGFFQSVIIVTNHFKR
jgi:hypothetical protein